MQPHLQANDLRNLRQITIHIPPDLVDYPKDDQLRVLRQVTGCLRGKATLHRLLLVIVFALWSNGKLFEQIQEQSGEGWHRLRWFLDQLRQLRQDGRMESHTTVWSVARGNSGRSIERRAMRSSSPN